MTLLERIKYHINEKKCTCWKGYKRVPGTKPCSNNSCVKEQRLAEAEYQGNTVTLNKPSAGDVKNKKSKVYVIGPNGKVVKVNFGDKNMTIKKHIPGRRKSFRARHNCDNAGPKWKAKYWSCDAWEPDR